jgi:hypothetical protein
MMAKPGVVGQCGCGRSPTGLCCGWHALSESEYQSQLESYLADKELDDYRRQAQELWSDSCTTPRKTK